MKYEEMAQAVRDARQVQEVVKSFANDFAIVLAPFIRCATSPSALARLKRELRDFDVRTGSWKTS